MINSNGRWPDTTTHELLAELNALRERKGIPYRTLATALNRRAETTRRSELVRAPATWNSYFRGRTPAPVECVELAVEELGGPADWRSRYTPPTEADVPRARLRDRWSRLQRRNQVALAAAPVAAVGTTVVAVLVTLSGGPASPVPLAGCGQVVVADAPVLISPEAASPVLKRKKVGQSVRFVARPDVGRGPNLLRAVYTPTYPVKIRWMFARDVQDGPCS